jgi:Xaa-Pro aminopeptidase
MHSPDADAHSETAARFARRRDRLREAVASGVIVIPGHPAVWRNADNRYPFRQSSHLLYLAPTRRPDAVLVLDADDGTDRLFAPPDHPDDAVWHGPTAPLAEEAAAFGIAAVHPLDELPAFLARQRGRRLHVPPVFVPALRPRLAAWLDVAEDALAPLATEEVVHALGDLRLRKDAGEVAEIERALEATARMFAAAFGAVEPGSTEGAVYGAMARSAFADGFEFSFSPIVSVRGEVLHNESRGNTMREGDLLLIDAGLETPAGYASDITRTVPVAGHFDDRQRGVYEVVLAAQLAAIAEIRPGASFRAIHDRASRVIAAGLRELGLMRGDPAEAVAAGAHALFFVHGLGHPLGLDVHDVHDLGDAVAYPAGAPRSEAFGTRFLRFGRDLEEGMVMTVEPGVYFIPSLIDQWRGEGRHAEFIDYDAVEHYRGFGGIRIEDDVLCGSDGAYVLGPDIPRMPAAVEQALQLRVSA